MIKASDGKVIVCGSGSELGAEATMILILLYNENEELFKDVIQHVSEFIESGQAHNMGRGGIAYEPNEFPGDW